MPRVPYVNPEVGENAIADKIRARRGGTLLGCDQAVLHVPVLADGWNTLLGGLRSSTLISDAVRELAILRTTLLLDVPYEYTPHLGFAAAAGLSDEQIQYARAASASSDELKRIYPDAQLRLAYEVAEAMTLHVKVPDDLADQLAAVFSAEQVVNLVTLVAAYNFTSRIVTALEVE